MAISDWGKKLGTIAQNTVEKSKELTEITKSNLVISNAEENIRNCQMRIGDYVIKNELLRDNLVLADIYTELDASNKTIVEQQAKIASIKAAGICSTCGADIGRTVNFCSVCGAQRKIADNVEMSGKSPRLCSGCNEELEEGLAFCPSCGKKTEE